MEQNPLILTSTPRGWALCYVRLSEFHSFKELTRYVTLREVKETLSALYRAVKHNLDSQGVEIDRQDIYGPLFSADESANEMKTLLRRLVANAPVDEYPEQMVFFANCIRTDMDIRIYHQKVRLLITAADAAEYSAEECELLTLLYSNKTLRQKVESLYETVKKELGLTARTERLLNNIILSLKPKD